MRPQREIAGGAGMGWRRTGRLAGWARATQATLRAAERRSMIGSGWGREGGIQAAAVRRRAGESQRTILRTLITNTNYHCQREGGIEQTHHLYKGRP